MEISSNRLKNKLEGKYGRGGFKETAFRVFFFQEILSDLSYIVAAKLQL